MAGEVATVAADIPQSAESQLEAIFAKRTGESTTKAETDDGPFDEDDERDDGEQDDGGTADDDSAGDTVAEGADTQGATASTDEEIEYSGKQFKLPKEIADVIKKAANLDKDYTTKTQELATLHKLAEDRVHFADFQAQVMQHAFKEASEVQALQAQIWQIDAINWNELIVSEPQRAFQLNIARQQLGNQLQAKQQVLADVGAKLQNAKKQHDDKQKELGSAELTRRIGKLTPETVQQMGALGQRLGLQERDFMSPAVLQALHMAAKFEAIQKTKPQIDKRVRDAKPMAAPAARTSVQSADANKVVALQQRYQKTGKPSDVEAFLANKFASKRKR